MSDPSLLLVVTLLVGCGGAPRAYEHRRVSRGSGERGVDAGQPLEHNTIVIASTVQATCVGTSSGLWCWGAHPVRPPGVAATPVMRVSTETVRGLAMSSSTMCSTSAMGTRCSLRREDSLTTFDLPFAAISIDAGESLTCAAAPDGAFWAWGPRAAAWRSSDASSPGTATINPQVFDCGSGCIASTPTSVWCLGATAAWPPATRLSLPVPVAEISGTEGSACALGERGDVLCWGWIHSPEGGLTHSDPTTVALPDVARSITSGRDFHCALLADGSVACWGSNDRGQLGRGDTRQHSDAARVEGIAAIDTVAAGSDHVCAATDGEVWCWGSRELGGASGTWADVRGPRDVEMETVRSLGARTVCGTRAAAPQCLGNRAGEIYALLAERPRASVAIAGETHCVFGDQTRCVTRFGAADIAIASAVDLDLDAYGSSLCVVTSTGQLFCADQERNGRDWRLEAPVTGQFIAVATSYRFACALDRHGGAHCFEHGTLRSGCPTEPYDGPLCDRVALDVLLDTRAVPRSQQLVTGETHACARTANGAVWCWGVSTRGQVPGGTPVSAPRRVEGIPAAVDIAADALSTCAVGRDGSVWCWGRSPLDLRASEPIRIPGLDGVADIVGGDDGYCATTATSTVRCFGAAARIPSVVQSRPQLVELSEGVPSAERARSHAGGLDVSHPESRPQTDG